MQTIGVNLYFDKDMNVFISSIIRKSSGVGIGADTIEAKRISRKTSKRNHYGRSFRSFRNCIAE